MLSEAVAQRIEIWPIDRLIFYARNPRKNDSAVDRMCGSIREFGFKIPVWRAATARSWTAICVSKLLANWDRGPAATRLQSR